MPLTTRPHMHAELVVRSAVKKQEQNSLLYMYTEMERTYTHTHMYTHTHTHRGTKQVMNAPVPWATVLLK